MDPRDTYKLVVELLPSAGGAKRLLKSATDVMRGGSANGSSIELRTLLKRDDALGHIYQAINAPALEAAYRGTARERRKFTEAEIPAVTQLFTPKWVVEFLLQNTLGKLWVEARPKSSLKRKWKWICFAETGCALRKDPHPNPPPEYQGRGKKTLSLQDIRICDPACGTMNFGLVAVDMLREMYREEGRLREPSEIDSSIVRNNLIGFDIDPTAIDLARRSLEAKIGRTITKNEHRLFVCDSLFDEKCDGPFDVVVTNPPYLSARNLEPSVVGRLKKRYPASWRDLYACFVLRALEMVRPGGRAGILAMQSFMFTAAFEKMRRELRERANVETVAHFGPGLFQVGNPGTLQTAAMVLKRKPAVENRAIFFRLVDAEDKRAALAKQIESNAGIELSQKALASSPRGAWMYWISPMVRRAFSELPTLGEIAPPRQGLATTDNDRFVRYWWEVERPGFFGERVKWMPYAKGGRFRRWYEPARHRVNWRDNGREIKAAIVERYPYLNGQWQWVAKNSAWYGREGITYSYLTSGTFSARRLEAGTIFDVAGSSLFPEDPFGVLGILNSSAAREFLSAINPTVNFQVGDLRQLPMPRSFPDELRSEVARAVECTRRLESFDETSTEFVQPEHWDKPESSQLLRAARDSEKKIDRIVAALYGMEATKPEPAAPDRHDSSAELARRWISLALGVWLGRWGKTKIGEVAALQPLDRKLCNDLREILSDRQGEKSATEIVAAVGDMERFFSRDFLPWHNRLYRDRPTYWGFGGNGKVVAVSSVDADADIMHEAFRAIGQTLPPGWRRWTDDGIRVNLAPLREWIAERKLRNSLSEVEADLRRGRLGFSDTSRWMRTISQGSSG